MKLLFQYLLFFGRKRKILLRSASTLKRFRLGHSPRHVPLLIQNRIPSLSKTDFADDKISRAAFTNCFVSSSFVNGPNSFWNCAAWSRLQSIKCESWICAKNCGICFGTRRRTLSSMTFVSSTLFVSTPYKKTQNLHVIPETTQIFCSPFQIAVPIAIFIAISLWFSFCGS